MNKRSAPVKTSDTDRRINDDNSRMLIANLKEAEDKRRGSAVYSGAVFMEQRMSAERTLIALARTWRAIERTLERGSEVIN